MATATWNVRWYPPNTVATWTTFAVEVLSEPAGSARRLRYRCWCDYRCVAEERRRDYEEHVILRGRARPVWAKADEQIGFAIDVHTHLLTKDCSRLEFLRDRTEMEFFWLRFGKTRELAERLWRHIHARMSNYSQFDQLSGFLRLWNSKLERPLRPIHRRCDDELRAKIKGAVARCFNMARLLATSSHIAQIGCDFEQGEFDMDVERDPEHQAVS